MRRLLAILLFLGPAALLLGQSPDLDLNRYYAYPVSAGFTYRRLTPLAEFASNFTVHEFSGTSRIPLPGVPIIAPVVQVGLIRFDSLDQTNPVKWDHDHFFLAPGVEIAQRISKEFELGGGATLGLTQSLFPNVADEPVGSVNLFAGMNARLTLNPSYNLSIDVSPGVRFLRPFSPFQTYAGLSYGIGISAHYRFGLDPDAARALIRAIRFGEIELPDVFAAMQSYYVDDPVGEVTIRNEETYPLEDVQVSFFQNGFMDSPTPSGRIPTLEPGESATIKLLASFNDEVFSREGITPLTGEVIATYTARGRPAEQRQAVTYDLHDKTALTWDDDRKVAAFITPADSALRNYASFVRRAASDAVVDGLSDSLQIAMQIYHGLAELDILYQEDPTSPFTQVQENTLLVDSVSLPRTTLTRATGDCDDLTVLYASLLEALGVQTGFMTTPGHIYVVFNSGVPSREHHTLHPDREMFLDVDGELWIPVEITLMGREDFMRAWRTGMELWKRAGSEPDTRGFYLTAEAQNRYRPVGLREQDLGLQYGDEASIRSAFVADRNRLVSAILTPLREQAEERRTARSYNGYGIAAAQLGRYDDAARAFRDASLRDRDLLSPRINLGSVSYLRGDYQSALEAYTEAERILRARGRDTRSTALAKVLINISQTHYSMKNYEQAEAYYAQASEEGPQVVQDYSHLANIASEESTGRAAQIGSGSDVFFLNPDSDE